MNKQIIFLSFILVSCLSACFTPQKISKLETLHESKEWYFGKEVLKKKQNGIEVVLIFDKYYSGRLVFKAEVRNYTEKTVMVDPKKFKYTFYDEKAEKQELTRAEQEVFAINPETELLDIDKQMSKEEAARANNSMMSLFNSATNLASDVSDVKNNRSKTKEEVEQRERADNYYRDSKIDYEIELNSLNSQRDFWDSKSLRKTTLPPHSSMLGIVMFYRVRKDGILIFEIIIGEEVFNFKYKHKLISPFN